MSRDHIVYPKRKVGGIEARNPATYILAVVAALAISGAIYTILAINAALANSDASGLYELLPYWVIGPPVWFWCDYFLVYRKFGDPEAFDSFKHAQHVSLAIWASVGLLLGGVATSDRFKQASPATLATGAGLAASANAPGQPASLTGGTK